MQFTLSVWNIINFFIIAAGIGISVLSMIQISKSPIDKQVKVYFNIFLSLVIIYVSMYLVRMLIDGSPGSAVRITLRIVTLTEFMVSGFMTFMLIVMIQYSSLKENNAKKAAMTAQGLLAAHVILLVIASFTDLYYYFDASNSYHRSKLYLLSNVFPVLLLIQGLFLLISFRSKYEKRILKAYWIYIVAPLTAVIIQAFFSEIKFILLATTVSAVNMFAVITSSLTEKYEKQKIESSRIETELSMATRIQTDMLPNIYPAFPDREEFDIFATMTPAKEVGGDFYDFFLIDDDHLGLVMADVSGKGVPAALFMMMSKILVSNFAMMGGSPAKVLEQVNTQICKNNDEEMFVTVWFGVLEISTGKVTAANAGHEYPMIKKADGSFELFKDKHGFVIGGMDGMRYKDYEFTLEKGGTLFLYTDGVAEATNAENELFGTERMLEALNADPQTAPKTLLENMKKAVDEFVGDAPQFDDLTMLGVKLL